jgi:RimJ/RimL family protein N-acetyltransferase
MSDALTQAPVLKTERLQLRGPLKSDLPEFTRFMTSSPALEAQGETISAEQAWFGFMTGIGHWQWHGFGFFTLALHGSEHPLGRVGLLKHSDWPQVELAWHLFEGAEGHGYATEAAQAVRLWAAEHLGIRQLVSYIDVENHRSQAVAHRLGAQTDGSRAPHEPEAEIWTHVPVKITG